MPTKISIPTQRELAFGKALSDRCLQEIVTRRVEDVAGLLGIAPIGVRALVWQAPWPLDMAFRVAEALELGIIDRLEQTIHAASEVQLVQ